jgi:microcystin-dependent protein
MSEPFIGQVQIFPYNFAPRGWAFCNGQILSIAQNTALFSLLGTNYGGNGQTTFGLPDLRGRAPISSGQGPGLASYSLGQLSGTESATLNVTNMPSHNHTTSSFCNSSEGGASSPAGAYLGKTGGDALYAPTHDNSSMGPMPPTGLTGGNQPFSILPPYLVLNYCIALEGIFPSRN